MKYKLTENTKEVNGITLYQIQALKDFGIVKKGDLGGWIEKEKNLSQEGNCWVYGNARVFNDAWVSDDAKVFGDAKVYGNALVFSNAMVYGNALVFSNAMVYGNAWVYGDALVYGNAKVFGDAKVFGGALVSGDARVFGGALVYGDVEDSEELFDKKCENNTKDVFDGLDVLSGDIEEVVIKGVRYKKVTETKTTWKKIS